MPNLCPLVFRSTHPSALIHPADEIIGVRFPRKVSYLILAHIDVTWDFWTSFWVAEMLGYPKTACMIQKTIIHDLIEILGILIHGIYVFQDHGFLSQDHHSWSNRLQFATAACGVPWMFFGEKGMMWWFCAMDVPTDAVIKTLIPFVDFKTFSRHFKTMEAFQDRTWTIEAFLRVMWVCLDMNYTQQITERTMFNTIKGNPSLSFSQHFCDNPTDVHVLDHDEIW